MSQYQFERLGSLIGEIISQNVPDGIFSWLQEKTAPETSTAQFNIAFVSMPRKTGKAVIVLTDEQEKNIQQLRPGFDIRHWTIDRLSRVWLLMKTDTSEQEKYFRTIEHLFPSAEVNELIALYSALPVLAYPEIWSARCAEGIRNNIGDVLQAIMCNNPYPSEYLNEAAWNQLVLKAFFTEKPIERITGIDMRVNEKLAKTLLDYAHERWAAHRSVNPQLWRCVGKFIDEEAFPDIEKIAGSANPLEKEAALLACLDSNYPPAEQLAEELSRSIKSSGNLTWNSLAEKTKDYVLQ